ncbi:SRPBCC domain-containing protein [Pendulispora albinea]|uniref:SRPBCC domain-containing protein n=1 Tax=Pendulispora albinea TaxID=2741071 RepID=A0ABZ2LZI1_9BACT
MPLKKDGTGKRWVEMEIVTPGTPERVWQALATGPGYAAWFTKAEIEEKVGGKIRFDFGPSGNSNGEVTKWEPPHRFEYEERGWSEGAPPLATEITITSRAGDRCLVRMVHWLFSSSDEWDDQIEGFEKGWPAFFEVLRLYLAHFAGQKASSFLIMNQVKGEELAIWKQLTGELGLGAADVGDVRSVSEQQEAWTGVVERIIQDDKQRYVLLRLTSPASGVVIVATYNAGEHVNASMTVFLYGDDAESRALASREMWQTWMAQKFPAAS